MLYTLVFVSAVVLHLCASVTKQYNLVLAKEGDPFGWESYRRPGGM